MSVGFSNYEQQFAYLQNEGNNTFLTRFWVARSYIFSTVDNAPLFLLIINIVIVIVYVILFSPEK